MASSGRECRNTVRTAYRQNHPAANNNASPDLASTCSPPWIVTDYVSKSQVLITPPVHSLPAAPPPAPILTSPWLLHIFNANVVLPVCCLQPIGKRETVASASRPKWLVQLSPHVAGLKLRRIVKCPQGDMSRSPAKGTHPLHQIILSHLTPWNLMMLVMSTTIMTCLPSPYWHGHPSLIPHDPS